MTSVLGRSAYLYIAIFALVAVICCPSIAWAQQDSDNGQIPDQDPMISAAAENTMGDDAGSQGGLDVEAAGVDGREGAPLGSTDAEGALPAVSATYEPDDGVGMALPVAEPTEGSAPAVTAPAPAKASAATTTTTAAPAAEAPATAKGAVDDGVYFIYSAKNASRALDVNGASKKSGANVLLWDGNGQTNQQWRITFDANTGNYTIVSVNSNMALAFKSASSGANVYQTKQSSATKGIWSIVKTSSGFAISPAKNGKVALDIEGGSAANGDNVELWTSSGESWQRFWLVAVNPKISAENTLDNGVYTIGLASSSKQRVDVDSASQANSANVLLYHSNGGFNQRWYVSRDKDNFYTITSVNSGKVLDVYGGSKASGSNVIQYAANGNANQKWQIRDNGDGTYAIISKLSGLALRAASAKDGANVSVSVDNESSFERFILTKSKLVGNGIYSVSPRSSMGKSYDVPDYSNKDGAQVKLWGYNAGMNQKYQLVDQGGETYTIQVAHSGKYLQDSAGKVVQSKGSGADSQLWQASWRGTGVVLKNKATGRVITVSGSGASASLVTDKADGRTSQRFHFTKRNLIEPGLYTLRSGTGTRVLDVDGASKSIGANVQLWASNGGNNQKYAIGALSNGYYTMVNLNSKKAVTAAGSKDGSNVRQNNYEKLDSQLWKAEVGPNGGVVFTNKQSGKVLSVAGNSNADGANVQLATKNGASGQTWNLKSTKTSDPVLNRVYEEALAYGSKTNYFVAVDLSNHRTVVLRRLGGMWIDTLNVTCSTGASDTPTTPGTFYVKARGYSFGAGYTCYYWTQFDHGHRFHSILYYEGTYSVMDDRLGYSISHGCVRLPTDKAKYIYEVVPYWSRVRVYY